jgi:autotransporter-associated beta strand protein
LRTSLYGNWSQFTGRINVFPGASGDSRVGGTGTNGDFRISNSYGYGKAAIYLTNWMYAYHTTAATTVAVGELSGAPNSFLTAGAWQVGAKNTDATFAGRITGTSINKVGLGTWTLTGANTYTGTTTVSAGTLLVNGSQLSANNTVTVASGATLGGTGSLGGATTINGKLSPGSNAIGTLTFTNTVVLTSGSTAYIEIGKSPKTNDLLRVVLGRLTYGGTLQVTNLSGTLTNGDSFKIFDATNYTGAFAALSPAAPGIGLAWNTNALYTNGTLAVITFVVPRFSNVEWTGTGLILSGTGGSVNGYYYILATTNIAQPLAQWTSIATNQFDAYGNFNCTNSVSAGVPQRFYRLQVP